MRKALLVTMYYEPLNLVPVRRMSLITEALKDKGFEVDVFTRKYSDHQLNASSLNVAREASEEEAVEGSVTRVAYSDHNKKLKYSKLLPPGLRGVYNLNQIDVYHYDFEERFRKWFTGKNNYDVIILSYGPPIILSVAIWLSRHTRARIIVDFRDAFITEHDSGLVKFFKTRNLRKLNNRIDGMLFASPGIEEITKGSVKKLKPAAVILNGVPPSEDNGTSDSLVPSELKEYGTIKALHAGSLYPGQDIDYFDKLFVAYQSQTGKDLRLLLMGLADYRPELTDAVELQKVPFEVSRKSLEFADLLILPVWQNRYTGFSGKLLEYLYSGNKILCGPNPQSDLAEILKTSPNAWVLSGTIEEDLQLLKTVLDSEIRISDSKQYESQLQKDKLIGYVEQILEVNA